VVKVGIVWRSIDAATTAKGRPMTKTLAAISLAVMLSLSSQSTAQAQYCDEPNVFLPPTNYVKSIWAWTVWPVWAIAYARAYVNYVDGWTYGRWYDAQSRAAFPPGQFWWRVRVSCWDRSHDEQRWCSGMWMPPDVEGGGVPPRPPDAHWKCPASHPVMSALTHVQVAGPPGTVYYTE
jgi:hypothetical protein